MDALERRLIDGFQRDFPLTPRPYADVAAALGVAEADVLAALRRLDQAGVLARVGAVVRPHAVGASTLAAMAVPAERLDEVAALVTSFDEVNHNYERRHRLNLWFVVAAPTPERAAEVLDQVRARTELEVLDLPLEEDYHLDLGFPIPWT